MEGPRQTPDEIRETAVEWFTRNRSGRVSAKERAAFEAWLDADEAHKQAYDEWVATWSLLGVVRHEPRILELREQVRRRVGEPHLAKMKP